MKPRTRRKRHGKTRWTVRLAEVVSYVLITVGGIGTMAALALVFVFLVWKTYPLFLPASVKTSPTLPSAQAEQPWRVEVDEYRLLSFAIYPDGTLRVFRLDTGTELEKRSLVPPGRTLAACSTLSALPDPAKAGKLAVALGFQDGSVQLGELGFTTRFLTEEQAPAEIRALREGEHAVHDGGLILRTKGGQLRLEKMEVELEDPIASKDESAAVELIDLSLRPNGLAFAVLTSDGKLRAFARENAVIGVGELTGGGEMTLPARDLKQKPTHLLLSGVGDNAFVVWPNGQMLRVSTQDLDSPQLVEETNLLDDPAKSVTAIQFLIGKTSLLVGDSSGRVRVWFRINKESAGTADLNTMVATHELKGPEGTRVTALASSQRTRMMAAGYANGQVRVFYVTSDNLMAEVGTTNQPIERLVIAPRDNGLLALAPGGIWQWDLDPGHPETTLRSMFLPVWYEGAEKPAHVWQSSGGDGFEIKLGLWPLVFGTLKATFYALLMGVPLALLAAIYTSEFLHPRAKAMVKPTIELMASLPSVVLGFLAALVFAPFVADIIPRVLVGLVSIPGSFLLGAYLWQMLPDKLERLLARRRFVFLCLTLAAGVATAWVIGPIMENILFDGDIKDWLNGKGPATNGWLLILSPLFVLGAAFCNAQLVNPWMRRAALHWSRVQCAGADLAKFVVGILLSVGAAWICGAFLSFLGIDPRDSLVGTYVQRNALVVGFVAGFAIIPIVYTLAEDALSSVPEHLRSASLGCGATPWQTARQIIIPTAMSGLFSAVMVGLGRAVGETMIMLMAGGNAPILEMNIFNGFRTLSANIAVELPEAVVDSTHFRTLFLAALLLFGMTFALNTVAEAVRQRFHRRAYQL